MSNRLTEAEKAFRKVLFLSPDSLEARTNLGAFLLKTGRYEESERELKRAILIDHDLGLLHRNLGALSSMTQRPKEATEEFETAVRLHEKNSDHRSSRKLRIR
jgi:tetratricopeptide (TPR) repeat protein